MAKRLKVVAGVGSAVGEWDDVIYIRGRYNKTTLGAGHAKRMLAQMHQSDLAPARIVAALGCAAALGVDLLVALLICLALVGCAARRTRHG